LSFVPQLSCYSLILRALAQIILSPQAHAMVSGVCSGSVLDASAAGSAGKGFFHVTALREAPQPFVASPPRIT
jgi:hypothetical protein